MPCRRQWDWRALARIGSKVVAQRFIKGDTNIALPLSGPHTAINTHLTAARNLAFTSFPLADLKSIGRPFGATVNDVVLALCDAALHDYLAGIGQPADKRLVAMVPINLRPPGSTAEGNFVTTVQVKLGHAGEDPTCRLQTVRDSMRTARALYADVPAVASQAYVLVAASLGALGMVLGLEGIMPPPLNLIISTFS